MSKKPGYRFTGEIRQQVECFKGHLKEQQHLDANTIRQKTNYAGYFLKWLETEHLQPQDTRYNDLLNFIDCCRLEGMSKTHVNRVIASVRDYYRFLKIAEPNMINPATGLYLKGTPRKVVIGTIGFKELETLYQSVETMSNRTKRNKVILGLFIYQAITTEELSKLEPGHVNLKEGKIHIPGNRRRNSRTLELKPFQVMELHQYLTEIRPKILAEITKSKPARKPDRINKTRVKEQLFVSINGSEHIKNSLLHLFRDVQKINPDILNAAQIRQSVITHWLKTSNLREVQYMAGHKYVSSTERYQTNSLDSLQSKLEKYHPLNRTNNAY
jgi:integrase/recombinase XerD